MGDTGLTGVGEATGVPGAVEGAGTGVPRLAQVGTGLGTAVGGPAGEGGVVRGRVLTGDGMGEPGLAGAGTGRLRPLTDGVTGTGLPAEGTGCGALVDGRVAVQGAGSGTATVGTGLGAEWRVLADSDALPGPPLDTATPAPTAAARPAPPTIEAMTIRRREERLLSFMGLLGSYGHPLNPWSRRRGCHDIREISGSLSRSSLNALPRWLIALFSSGLSSAEVRVSPSGTKIGS